jgi:arylsulfatase A
MPSFPPEVVEAYISLRQREGDISTSPGASLRPHVPNLAWSWEPEDRR